ncbi:lipoprotein-releasing system ATP-binding protein LolD [Alphaproteobacteria bacterium]|nr:lipoprotein-releasing system ATP-binding protein LolD [Alphaproteobacteria bacterium]
MQHDSTIVLENISKHYSADDVLVLKEVSLEVRKSEFVALLGPSGSGKSTLLHIAGLLDDPTDGNLFIESKNTRELSDNEKTSLRLSKLGFVYQYHHLLQEFSALGNVMLPLLINNVGKKAAAEKAAHLLAELGLKSKVKSYPSELSGGQKQRVAIARALANDPVILLADEPTGNLDHETANVVLDDLLTIMQKTKMSAIIATHNYELAEKMSARYHITEGVLIKK